MTDQEDNPRPITVTEGLVKGGQNPPNLGTARPSPPQGSDGESGSQYHTVEIQKTSLKQSPEQFIKQARGSK